MNKGEFIAGFVRTWMAGAAVQGNMCGVLTDPTTFEEFFVADLERWKVFAVAESAWAAYETAERAWSKATHEAIDREAGQ